PSPSPSPPGRAARPANERVEARRRGRPVVASAPELRLARANDRGDAVGGRVAGRRSPRVLGKRSGLRRRWGRGLDFAHGPLPPLDRRLGLTPLPEAALHFRLPWAVRDGRTPVVATAIELGL